MKHNHDTPMSQPLNLFLTSLSMPDTDTSLRAKGKPLTMKELLNNSTTTNELLLESRN